MFAGTPPLWRSVRIPLVQPFGQAFRKGTHKGKELFSASLPQRVSREGCVRQFTPGHPTIRENPKNGQVGAGRIVEAEISQPLRNTKNK